MKWQQDSELSFILLCGSDSSKCKTRKQWRQGISREENIYDEAAANSGSQLYYYVWLGQESDYIVNGMGSSGNMMEIWKINAISF